jgi:hypothetical protein
MDISWLVCPPHPRFRSPQNQTYSPSSYFPKQEKTRVFSLFAFEVILNIPYFFLGLFSSHLVAVCSLFPFDNFTLAEHRL